MRPAESPEGDRPESDRPEGDRPEAGPDAGNNPAGAPGCRVEYLVQPEDATSSRLVEPYSSRPESPGEPPTDPLAGVVAPVLAGFVLATVVIIGTSNNAGYPARAAASACFVGSAASLIFSMQMLAIGRRGRTLAKRHWYIRQGLYELGLLLLLTGLGLFLWPAHWSAAAYIGVIAAFGVALVDLSVTIRNFWPRRRSSPRVQDGEGGKSGA